ncbi:MAG TPA: alpha/beta hydrolase [Longimicrobiaceae bacterium]|nr:alpha/beta hydrolase [Longimicrobiaceae bacterium]
MRPWAARAGARLDSRWLAGGRSRLPSTPDTRLVDLPAARVRVRVTGSGGRTLVIVPDPPNTIEHYDRLIERLAPEFRVICLEAPGFGFSHPKPGFRFTLDEWASTLVELFDRLEVRAATLSMSCLGAFAALVVARRRPDQVERLVLMQIPSADEMKRWVLREDVLGIFNTPVLGQAAVRATRRLIARQWYRSALPPGADPEPYLRTTLRAFERGACFCLASGFQVFRAESPDLSGVQQPAAVLWGGADGTHRDTDRRSILTHLPHARWMEIDGCGHFPDLERPDVYLDVLRAG